MNIGMRIKDKQGDEGIITRQLTLRDVAIEEGTEPQMGDEDMFYIEAERPNGSRFFAFEGDCKVMRG